LISLPATLVFGQSQQTINDLQVQVRQGLLGTWKVGYETPLIVESGSPELKDCVAEFTTVDGDGVPVIQKVNFEPNESADGFTAKLNVRHGRSNRSMQLRILRDGQSIFSRELQATERGQVLPLDQPWIVAIGSDLQIEDISVASVRGGLPSVSLTTVMNVKDLPESHYVYDACTMIVLSASDTTLLDRITPLQGKAIADFVENGGRLQIWVGAAADHAKEIDWLNRLIPGKITGVSNGVDPSLLESFIVSNQTTRLNDLTCATIEPGDCRVEFSLMTADRQSLPLIIHSARGAGIVDVVATDINSPALLQWKDRIHLIQRLFRIEAHQQAKKSKQENAIQFVGYDDISGQIRASLDLFDNVHSGTISLMSVFAILFLAFIGPIDYFFFHKSLRRSVWTWLTLLISCVTLVTLTQILTASWKPEGVVINSMDIVDYHFDTARVVGNSFIHQYSKKPNQYHLNAQAIGLHETKPDNSGESQSASPTYLRWSGKPGGGLGGFDSDVRIDVGMPAYEIKETATADEFTSDISGVGIPAAGSYAARASWKQSCETILGSHQLSNYPGSDLLEGSFSNPLTLDLVRPVLFYESWAYPLKDRVKPGESIMLSIANAPKDLSRQLQQKRTVGDREQVVPWDRTSRRDAPRLLELLSLYKACGGKQYVGLEQGYLNQFDLSAQLPLNRAVLIAQVEKPAIKWNASTKDKIEVCSDGYRTTIVRFLLPVEDR
jgi:hypothetical protein